MALIALQSAGGQYQTIGARATYKMCNPDHEEIVSHVTADRADHELFEGLNDQDLAALDERFAVA